MQIIKSWHGFLSGIIMTSLLAGCQNTANHTTIDNTDARVDSVMKLMTLDEKIGQMVLFTSDWDVTGPTMKKDNIEFIRKGLCGNIFNAYTAKYTRSLQKIAVEESRLHIPLLFGYDVIHGHKTIFPISLGESASWDLDAIKTSARVSAHEAAAMGINWTFAPMVDICIDPRWGRISEGAGEDPYLGSLIAKARVQGFQGDDNNLADPLTILACVKHYAAYGAPQAGRDYNTVDMSERLFRDIYLPPYRAAVDAGAMSVMTSFNELNGVPATANKWLMTDILRGEMGFKGLVVTDYTAINELVKHGVAEHEAEAGKLAIKAGVDMDMEGQVYYKHLKQLVEKGEVKESEIDEAVRRILKVKFLLGLFDDPYRYCSEEREKALIYAPEHLEAAHQMALKSMVLLKNNNNVLPLQSGQNILVVGQLANSKRDLLGSWKAAGDWDQITTILDEIQNANGAQQTTYIEGCQKMGDDRSQFAKVLSAAKKADKIVMVAGEDCDWCGEAASRSDIHIPGVQTELLAQLKTLGKPIVLVVLNGRPLDLTTENELADAILIAWFPGTKGALATADILFGKYNPSGKLTTTFPRSLGQVPLCYYAKNTGRPVDPNNLTEKYKSRYLDIANDPLFPFGFGLSYTNFAYSDLTLSDTIMTDKSTITASIKVSNTGKYDGNEVVQLYTRDITGSVTRPLKELKGFHKISLKAGESQTISFTISPDMLAFHRLDMSYGTEPGLFKVFVGGNSRDVKQAEFRLK